MILIAFEDSKLYLLNNPMTWLLLTEKWHLKMNEEEITKEKAEEWYENAGISIPEDPEEITLNEHTHLFNDSVLIVS